MSLITFNTKVDVANDIPAINKLDGLVTALDVKNHIKTAKLNTALEYSESLENRYSYLGGEVVRRQDLDGEYYYVDLPSYDDFWDDIDNILENIQNLREKEPYFLYVYELIWDSYEPDVPQLYYSTQLLPTDSNDGILTPSLAFYIDDNDIIDDSFYYLGKPLIIKPNFIPYDYEMYFPLRELNLTVLHYTGPKYPELAEAYDTKNYINNKVNSISKLIDDKVRSILGQLDDINYNQLPQLNTNYIQKQNTFEDEDVLAPDGAIKSLKDYTTNLEVYQIVTPSDIDDAAVIELGLDYRMPTAEEWQSLINNCYFEFVNAYNGVSLSYTGLICYKAKQEADKGKIGNSSLLYFINDPHIILPATGRRIGRTFSYESAGYYWSSTASDATQASFLFFRAASSIRVNRLSREWGAMIRPVCESPKTLEILILGMVPLYGDVLKNEHLLESWTSTNKGINSSTSSYTWTLSYSTTVLVKIDYTVSTESGYDNLIVLIDSTTVLLKSGIENSSYTTELSAGLHTIVASYTKDASQHSNNDEVTVAITVAELEIVGTELDTVIIPEAQDLGTVVNGKTIYWYYKNLKAKDISGTNSYLCKDAGSFYRFGEATDVFNSYEYPPYKYGTSPNYTKYNDTDGLTTLTRVAVSGYTPYLEFKALETKVDSLNPVVNYSDIVMPAEGIPKADLASDVFTGYATETWVNLQGFIKNTVTVVDNLTSTTTNEALSAKQGKILKDLIDGAETRVGNAETRIGNVETLVDGIETILDNIIGV